MHVRRVCLQRFSILLKHADEVGFVLYPRLGPHALQSHDALILITEAREQLIEKLSCRLVVAGTQARDVEVLNGGPLVLRLSRE
jgi:hypothetical protein